eukprot:CAMPEP_0171107776 /NCGR_PEP_ID=MMETSP0766_2-20121228/67540_1 /TAXON_ID=439317 /ORGANISM="Gambierdiscus australes, Strain CAWD 149" /LENGTH=345 /DNA_ID=CAMNT_0011569167 /DNA_START=103 /DNA_END=1138 /DNA_ORIENTATION=+
MDDGTKVRTNGFERPFHPLQVLSWVVFGSDVLIYLVFCLPLIDTVGAKVLVALVYTASVVTLVFFTVKATSCDPADPHVHMDSSQVKAEDMQTMPYCTVCNVPVHSRSKHCRACNKCVSVFDHHCMWLNNCIGAANYRAFFTTVCSVAVMIGIVLGTCVYLLIDYFAGQDGFQDRAQSMAFYRSFPVEFFLGLLLTMMFVNVPLFVLDMQLVLLHLFLMSQHLTTYEYIVNKRQQGSDETRMKFGQRIKTLPHCMDWIVFSRCGQRRKKKKRNADAEAMTTQGDQPDAKAVPMDVEAVPMDTEAASTELGSKDVARAASWAPFHHAADMITIPPHLADETRETAT